MTIRRFNLQRLLDQLVADLERHEGFREFAYPDPQSKLHRRHPRARWGFKPASILMAELGETGNENQGRPWTVGYGFTHNTRPHTRISKEHARVRLRDEIIKHIEGLDILTPSWKTMPFFAQTVLANMIFNMGTERLSKFAPTLAVMEEGKWFRAARRLRGSLWFKQVGVRAVELCNRLEKQEIAKNHLVVAPEEHTIDTGMQCKYIGE